jgi:hypothetical protein
LSSIEFTNFEYFILVNGTQPSLTISSPGDKLPVDPCQDKANNCDQYGTDVCSNYRQWAQTNCAKTCGFCTRKHLLRKNDKKLLITKIYFF